MQEVIFEVREDEIDVGFVATCLGHSIVTQAENVEELREMVKDAVHCHFEDGTAGETPSLIRLYFVRDEVLIA
jgi:predicted RNase H-like HicB family nuclease